MLVHYAGIVGDLSEFEAISKEYALPIIEDAAHALGAKYKGKMIGSISAYTIFSFQAIKHMTTVDGGLLTVKSHDDHERARVMRWFGLDKTKDRLVNNIDTLGYKYSMNNVNATIGLVQLDGLDKLISSYIENGKYFDEHLQGVNGIEAIQHYEGSEPSYWLYTIKAERRDDLMRWLGENGISASPLHLRNDRHRIFGGLANLPNLDYFYSKLLHFGCGWWIGKEEREYIVETIEKGW
jgi:dTDP-4-amino-4,6-dideoxygalactose transaminase